MGGQHFLEHALEFDWDGTRVTMGGMAKGSGMIAPNRQESSNTVPSLNPNWVRRRAGRQSCPSSVPILQISLSSKTLSEADVYDFALWQLRQRLNVIRGLTMPTPYGGLEREIMVDLDPGLLQARGVSAKDVADAFLKEGTIGGAEYAALTSSTAPTLWGLEHMADHEANVQSVRDSLKKRPTAGALLKDLSARAAGLKTSIDCVSEDSQRFRAVIAPVLPEADLFFANDFEAEKTTGIPLRQGGSIVPAAVVKELDDMAAHRAYQLMEPVRQGMHD